MIGTRPSWLIWRVLLLASLLLPGLAQDGTPTNDSAMRLLWRAAYPHMMEPPLTIPAVASGHIFVAPAGIQAYSASGGELAWQGFSPKYSPRSLVADDNFLFVTDETVSALDIRSGLRVWEFKPDANTSMGRATVANGVLYFGTSSGKLYAVRSADGHQLWMASPGKDWPFPAIVRGVTVKDGVLYATFDRWRNANGLQASGPLFALDAATGAIIWSFETGAGDERRGLSSSPSVTADLVIAADYLGNAIIALDRRTGHQVWRFAGEPGYAGFPEAPVIAGNRVYAASGDTYVYALDLPTGHLLWRAKMPGGNNAYAMCGNNLLVNQQGLVVLDPQTGHIRQTMLNSSDEYISSGFAVAGNTAYVMGTLGVYALACR